MGAPTYAKRGIAASLLLLVIACGSGQAAAESDDLMRRQSRLNPGNPVLLQIRISEAKKRRETLRYYKSIARRRNAGNLKGASDRTGKPTQTSPCRP